MNALTCLRSFSDPLLGQEARVRHHTLLALASLPTYLANLGMIWHLVHLDELAAPSAWGITLASIVTFLAFWLPVRTGLTQRMKDPVLTFPHALASLGLCIVAYMLLDEHRVNVLVLMAQVIVVAMLRLRPKQVLVLGMLATLMLCGAFAWVDWRDTSVGMLNKGATHLMVGGASLLLLSLVGKWVSDIRTEISEQAKESRKTVLTVRQMATMDQLTGLLNRRVMLETLEAERQLSERHGTQWCVALIDLDHFKQVNDRYGHPTGDAVLRGFADLARKHLRSVDQVGRWGGEEFLVMFPQTRLNEAHASLERLRKALNAWRLPDHPTLQMSFSAGLVQAAPEDSLDQLVERADKTMYQAKASGRNRSVWAPLLTPDLLGSPVPPPALPT
ncbi:MAG: GGDEF domain-containing protein [Burkholderiaceae bacterium]|nr:MAG: GGDEF domain-containing protein [Burkholderiaceae bacterium]